MSPNRKFERLIEKPPRKDITFDDLKSGLISYGFVVDRINGSHYILKHPQYPNIRSLVIPKPHGGNKTVLRTYISQVQEIIEMIEEQKNEKK